MCLHCLESALQDVALLKLQGGLSKLQPLLTGLEAKQKCPLMQ